MLQVLNSAQVENWFSMVDFDKFTEDQMDDLTQQVVELYTTISEEALSLNDPEAYAKVRKITNDDDYSMECRFRNLTEDDEFDPSEFEIDNCIVAEVWFTGAQEQLKNDVHVVDIVFEANRESSNEASAKWFPDD